MSGGSLKFAAGVAVACLMSTGLKAQTPTGVGEIVVHPPANSLAETRQKKVSYADLNLGTESGQAALVRRIKAAGREVCSPVPSSRTLNTKDYKQCYDGATSGALADLGNSDVSAMYAKMK